MREITTLVVPLSALGVPPRPRGFRQSPTVAARNTFCVCVCTPRSPRSPSAQRPGQALVARRDTKHEAREARDIKARKQHATKKLTLTPGFSSPSALSVSP